MRAALLVLAACSGAAPPEKLHHPPFAVQPLPDAAIDAAPPVSQEETLAAIQKAMNELAPASQQCWAAAAAVDGFRIGGDLALRVTVPGHAEIVTDTVHDATLTGCMTNLLANYRYAPPLAGQSFQLPFHFTAPDGQSTIDRRYVPAKTQDGVSVSVLIDEVNSGNAAASMFELAIAGDTGLRKTDRAELWYFLTDAEVTGPLGLLRAHVAAGDMMYVPAGGARAVGTSRAVVVAVPGGREGAARGGALPTPIEDVTGGRPPTKDFHVFPAAQAKRFDPATIFVEPATEHDAALAASILAMPAGSAVRAHVHPHETELLYVLEGSATLGVGDSQLPLRSTMVVQIPPNTPHSLAIESNFRALQIYTPAGPEQRFKHK
ncbi:MAG TPA: cupin domain-containing protein [Kofleriaceae bacterium]|jgi:quercetin dioxygenase-like cupin family protein